MMSKEKPGFDRWIFDSHQVSAEGLGLLRIFIALFLLFFLIPGQGLIHFEYLAGLPDGLFAPPPGPLLLMDGFPGLAVFQVLHTVLLFLLIGMFAGYRTKLTSILSGITILILQGLIYSVGKINHEILIAMVPVVMAFSNWGAVFSLDSLRKGFTREVQSWPITLIALLIGFMMFTAGFPKILGGWLDPATQATQGHLFNQFYVREREALLAAWFVNLNYDVFWELLDWATVLFEIGFLFAVISGKWFKRFVCLAVIFHFFTMMMLNIAFLPNFLAYAVFLNWTQIYEFNLRFYNRIMGKKGVRSKKQSVWMLSGVFLILFSGLRYFSSKELVFQNSDLMLHEVVVVLIAVLIVIFLAARALLAAISNTPTRHP